MKTMTPARTRRVFFLLALSLFSAPIRADEPAPGNRFVYAVLDRGPGAEPYGDLWPQLAEALRLSTSLDPWPRRRLITWNDDALFESPFLLVAGRGALALTESDLSRLRDFLAGGGFLLLDNTEAEKGGPFGRSVAALPARLVPGESWREVPADHAVFRSFYLLRRASGRRRTEGKLWGLWTEGRLSVVYAPDDLEGAWVRAPAGGWLFPCQPDGEPQRAEAQHLLMNLVMYSLTGTYKTDAIHQEFLKRRLGESP